MNFSIDIKLMMYMNLFERITKVKAKRCFFYNNCLFFLVDKKEVSKAIGKNGKNSSNLGKTLKKKIRIVFFPEKEKEINDFIKKIIEPINVEDVQIKNNKVEICADLESRSMIIGRNREREKELKKILGDLFNIKEINFLKKERLLK